MRARPPFCVCGGSRQASLPAAAGPVSGRGLRGDSGPSRERGERLPPVLSPEESGGGPRGAAVLLRSAGLWAGRATGRPQLRGEPWLTETGRRGPILGLTWGMRGVVDIVVGKL